MMTFAFIACLIIWLFSIACGVCCVLRGVCAGLSDNQRRALTLTHAIACAGGVCACLLGLYLVR